MFKQIRQKTSHLLRGNPYAVLSTLNESNHDESDDDTPSLSVQEARTQKLDTGGPARSVPHSPGTADDEDVVDVEDMNHHEADPTIMPATSGHSPITVGKILDHAGGVTHDTITVKRPNGQVQFQFPAHGTRRFRGKATVRIMDHNGQCLQERGWRSKTAYVACWSVVTAKRGFEKAVAHIMKELEVELDAVNRMSLDETPPQSGVEKRASPIAHNAKETWSGKTDTDGVEVEHREHARTGSDMKLSMKTAFDKGGSSKLELMKPVPGEIGSLQTGVDNKREPEPENDDAASENKHYEAIKQVQDEADLQLQRTVVAQVVPASVGPSGFTAIKLPTTPNATANLSQRTEQKTRPADVSVTNLKAALRLRKHCVFAVEGAHKHGDDDSLRYSVDAHSKSVEKTTELFKRLGANRNSKTGAGGIAERDREILTSEVEGVRRLEATIIRAARKEMDDKDATKRARALRCWSRLVKAWDTRKPKEKRQSPDEQCETLAMVLQLILSAPGTESPSPDTMEMVSGAVAEAAEACPLLQTGQPFRKSIFLHRHTSQPQGLGHDDADDEVDVDDPRNQLIARHKLRQNSFETFSEFDDADVKPLKEFITASADGGDIAELTSSKNKVLDLEAYKLRGPSRFGKFIRGLAKKLKRFPDHLRKREGSGQIIDGIALDEPETLYKSAHDAKTDQGQTDTVKNMTKTEPQARTGGFINSQRGLSQRAGNGSGSGRAGTMRMLRRGTGDTSNLRTASSKECFKMQSWHRQSTGE